MTWKKAGCLSLGQNTENPSDAIPDGVSPNITSKSVLPSKSRSLNSALNRCPPTPTAKQEPVNQDVMGLGNIRDSLAGQDAGIIQRDLSSPKFSSIFFRNLSLPSINSSLISLVALLGISASE